jgi:hypothetical protein
MRGERDDACADPVMKRRVVVNDRNFEPQLTPTQMLRLGVSGGKSMTDCRDEFPASWFSRRSCVPPAMTRGSTDSRQIGRRQLSPMLSVRGHIW